MRVHRVWRGVSIGLYVSKCATDNEVPLVLVLVHLGSRCRGNVAKGLTWAWERGDVSSRSKEAHQETQLLLCLVYRAQCRYYYRYRTQLPSYIQEEYQSTVQAP